MNLKNPELYINRELSWLQFNTRVLKQAQDKSLPPLERLKFLAIYGTNLDEFYMIRVAGLKKLFNAGIIVSGADKLTPLQQLRSIREYLHQEQQVVEHCKKEIFKELEEYGIRVKEYDEVTSTHKKHLLNEKFFQDIYHLVIPIAVDATHPFPHLNNLSFGIAIKLVDTENEEIERYGIIRIPRVLDRFIELGDGEFVPIESIVAKHVDSLFPGYHLVKQMPFRVTRNADIAIEEEEADDFLEMLEEGLKLRKKGEMVRLEVGNGGDEELIAFLNRHINVYKDDIYTFHTCLNLSSLWQIVSSKNFAHLLLPSFKPKILPPLDSENIFTAMEKHEILLYHPFESFEPIVKFIQDAAKDPEVVSIKMTLYRAGTNSPIVKALIDASESGKQVTVMVELKARFDEENNLVWAKALENAGAHVIYGIKGFKVHAKAALVTKRTQNGLLQYAHLGTGNYNPTTAKIYTDFSYLTSNQAVTNDLTRFFHFLTGFSKKGKLNELYMSPSQIKPKILSLIQNEARKGKEGHIIAKMNSLVDDDVIRALYKASQAGTKVDLIIRGICCLRPGIKGVSENIRVISIVGKYLEHPRAFYFKNDANKVYISSADWMPRNLIRRIELLTAITDETSQQKIIQVLKLQLNDNANAHELLSDGSYKKIEPKEGQKAINNHKLLEEYVNKIAKASKKETPTQVQQLAQRLFVES